MTEYVIFNAEHYITVEEVRFYEQGDALEDDARDEALAAMTQYGQIFDGR